MDKVFPEVRLKITRLFLPLFAFFFLCTAAGANAPASDGGLNVHSISLLSSGILPEIQGNSGNTDELAFAAGSFSFLQVPASAAGADPVVSETGLPPVSLSVEKDSLVRTLGILVLVLVSIVLLLLFISANLTNLIRIREGKEAMSFGATLNRTKEMMLNPYINSVVMLVGMVIGLFIIVPIARGVGHHEGYQPDQPIKFSHKIHAGDWKINCQYCHTGASRGKYATIPPTNVCLNCHKAIQSGKRWGKEEINKIQMSAMNNEPIQWTRIHNLPDLAYFSHQPHVLIGKVPCTKCHGDVANMDYPMFQQERLSMGFCINCHRETNVDAELYKTLGFVAKDKDHPLKAADVGLIDCVRCHY